MDQPIFSQSKDEAGDPTLAAVCQVIVLHNGGSLGNYEANDSLFWGYQAFLDANEDIGPASRPKLLAILADAQKLAILKIELAATNDCREPFVKACYLLEGDGPLALTVLKLLRSESCPLTLLVQLTPVPSLIR